MTKVYLVLYFTLGVALSLLGVWLEIRRSRSPQDKMAMRDYEKAHPLPKNLGEGEWNCHNCKRFNRLGDNPEVTALNGVFKSIVNTYER